MYFSLEIWLLFRLRYRTMLAAKLLTHTPTARPTPIGVGGGVSAAFPDAVEAGLRMLRAGGNAVDAACAAAWALAICEPAESGLGGQGTLLLYIGGKAIVIDGHSRAPAAASRSTISHRDQMSGIRSTTIPTTPATLGRAQARFGTLPLAEVLAPAIQIAENGYGITRLQRRLLTWTAPHWEPGSPEAATFLSDGKPYKIGQIFRQPKLAETLRLIARHGVREFYEGSIAHDILKDMSTRGGLISAADLAAVMSEESGPSERAPLVSSYRSYRVLGTPPPAGGVQVQLALNLLERLLHGDEDESSWRVALALATRTAFRERERWPDHPGDVTPSILSWMVSSARAEMLADRVRAGMAEPPIADSLGEEGNTTHLTATDRHGNVACLTQSIQSVFGSKACHPTLGFVYNNYLSTCPRSTHPYKLAPGALPQSNAAPTIVLDSAGGPALALGSAGSRRIASSIVQTISAVLDRGMSLSDAVASPRAHALLNGGCWHESSMPAECVRELKACIGQTASKGPTSIKLGAVQALRWTDGRLEGAADPRRDGRFAAV